MAESLFNISDTFDTGVITDSTKHVVRVDCSDVRSIIIVSVLARHDDNGAGSSPIVSIADSASLTWTLITDQEFQFDVGGDDHCRHYVWWARNPNATVIDITTTQTTSIYRGNMLGCVIRGGSELTALDVNAAAYKETSHEVGDVTSAIVEMATDDDDLIVMGIFAGANVSDDPGTITGFTEVVEEAVGSVRQHLVAKTITAALTDEDYTWSTATNAASACWFAIRKTVDPIMSMRVLEGFDHWEDKTELHPGATLGSNMWTNTGVGVAPAFVTGRDGVGRAIQLGASTIDGERLKIDYFRSMGVQGRSKFGVAYDDIGDGEHFYFGLNIKTAYSVRAGWAGLHVVIKIGSATETSRISLCWDADNDRWELLEGGTSPASQGINGTSLGTFTPSADPIDTWRWFEFHVFRDDTVGRIEVWQETDDAGQSGHPHPPWQHNAAYTPKGNNGGGKPSHFKTEKIFDYTGDTSVATIGAINMIQLMSDKQTSGTNTQNNQFDDFYMSNGNRAGVPCYVKTIYPTSDVAGGAVWDYSTGTDFYALVDEAVSDPSDYWSADTGNPKQAVDGFPALPYVPRQIFCANPFAKIDRASGSTRPFRIYIESNGVEVHGIEFGVATAGTYCINGFFTRDPGTDLEWTKTDLSQIEVGVECPEFEWDMTANTLDADAKVIQLGIQVLCSIEAGGADSDSVGGGGNTLLAAAQLTGLEPIKSGQFAGLGNLHHIEDGINNPDGS